MEEYLNSSQQAFLLDLARRTIQDYLQSQQKSKPKIEDKDLKEKRGAFVTLKTEGELRGCIGYVLPHHPLYETIIDAAVAAATQDFRFQPMTLEEMDKTKIEISVLTLPRSIKKVEDIEVGKHGIIITRGLNKGLLLPQVPLEWGWDRETYLKHGCLKAGLEEDAWKKGAQIEIFSAQVFSE